MLLKIQFLESNKRKRLFEQQPPQKVYVATNRILCAKNGNFKDYNGSALCYAWYIWEKGFKGDPIIKWFN